MNTKCILFLTANTEWGGSEVLWALAAERLSEKGYQVKAGAFYHYGSIKRYVPSPQNFFDLQKRLQYPGFIVKGIQKIFFGRYKPTDRLLQWIRNIQPALIVISQGNNVVGYPFMQICTQLKIPFVTITQLVPERIWPTLDEKLIVMLRLLYVSAQKNYFVSKQNLLVHETIMGQKFSNAAIVYNPFNATRQNDIPFPGVENNTYKIALVGRIEFFHKGYDLFLDVVKQQKWKDRKVIFSIFGNGPHLQLLYQLMSLYEIENVTVHKYASNISSVWKGHHILLMPSRMEGQSLALIEAMHYKRAAIVTRVGGADELVEEGLSGFIADSPTVKSIDEALEKAWNHKDRWQQMGETAQKHIMEKHPPDAVQYFNDQISSFF